MADILASLPITNIPDSDILKENPLEVLARQLAGEYLLSQQVAGEPLLLHLLESQEKLLERAYHHFSSTAEDGSPPSYAAEWLLDNFFVVQQAIRQVREDMPAGYYQQLPKLKNTVWANYPRIYALAREAIGYGKSQINIAHTIHLIQTFQVGGVILTMGELWAFPTMLRLGILDNLTNALTQLIQTETPSPSTDDNLVGNCITSLRALAIQDWKFFFEDVCVVEQILRLDPIYPAMDFDTRNSYRTAVENLAHQTKQTEPDVARRAIALSTAIYPDGQSALRKTHVGYYLIGAGREQLEDQPTLRRWLSKHPTLTYLGSIAVITGLFVLLSMIIAAALGAVPIVAGLLTLLPFSAVAVNLVNWRVTHRLSPRILSRLDFQNGVPADYQTMIVIPTLLTDTEEIDSLLQQLELHYLRNADPALYFALLTDYDDASSQDIPADAALISRAQAGIIALNTKYKRDISPFYLFHRGRRWNAKQNTWMGWERKRGKLQEFNRLLRNDTTTSYIVQVGDLSILPDIHYVITLDADSILPEDSARRLIATLAHPLKVGSHFT